MSLIEQLFKKALPLSEASGAIFRRHRYLENPYRNFIIYTIIYFLSIIPSFIQPVTITILIIILTIYTLRILKYIKDIRIIFVPFFKIAKDLISIVGFWKGYITGKQTF